MKLNHRSETGSLYIDLADEPSTEGQEIRLGIVLDFHAKGRLVGIGIDHASQNATITSLIIDELSVREPVVP